MNSFIAQELIDISKEFRTAHRSRMAQRPRGMIKSAWLGDVDLAIRSFHVVDTAFKTEPKRELVLYPEDAHRVWVWGCGNSSNLIEKIDLRAPDADKKLARYKKVANND